DAKKAIAAAHATAVTLKTNLSCVVLDSRGAVIAAERMDKAGFFTIDIARGKALVSASFGSPSGALAQLATSGIGSVLPGPGTPVFLQGAVPLKGGGAIGCSGGTGQQDEDGAKAGAAAIGAN
ncbi:MAG: heme-binding protein, partial [Vicinamibacterales bacterium]